MAQKLEALAFKLADLEQRNGTLNPAEQRQLLELRVRVPLMTTALEKGGGGGGGRSRGRSRSRSRSRVFLLF